MDIKKFVDISNKYSKNLLFFCKIENAADESFEVHYPQYIKTWGQEQNWHRKLNLLLEEGLLKEVGVHETGRSGQPSKIYRLTASGKRLAKQIAEV